MSLFFSNSLKVNHCNKGSFIQTKWLTKVHNKKINNNNIDLHSSYGEIRVQQKLKKNDILPTKEYTVICK